MSSTDYEYITAILGYGSITEASKKLFISQSALSQYVKRIELKLGIEIFDRDFYPLKLTAAGEIYYKSLVDIMKIEENALNQIEDLNNLKRGEVVIGVTDYLAYYLLSKVLSEFNRSYPGIKIKLFEGKTRDINLATLDGTCDFSITYDVLSKDGMTNIKLYEEEVYIAMPVNNPIAKTLDITYPQEEIPTIDIKLLKNSKIIGMKKGQNLRHIFRQLDKYTDNSLETILETDSMYLANKFVAEGLGITIIPSAMAMDNKLECVFVKTNPELSKRTVMIHNNSARKLNKPAEILIEMLNDYVKNNFEERQQDEL